jgi:hypothetical protein
MIRNRLFIATNTFIVIFFLTFLGMRISLLDKTPRPKSKPRAVINSVVKSAQTTTNSSKQSYTPIFDIALENFAYIIPAFITSVTPSKEHSNPVEFYTLRPLTGRSPPLC